MSDCVFIEYRIDNTEAAEVEEMKFRTEQLGEDQYYSGDWVRGDINNPGGLIRIQQAVSSEAAIMFVMKYKAIMITATEFCHYA